MNSKRLRILLLAPGSNPNWVTGPLMGYFHGKALSRIHTVTFVIEAKDEDAVRKANGSFHTIESISLARLDRFYDWVFRRIFKGDRGNPLWTAARFPRAIAFEWLAWKKFRARIYAGEFDVVLRILPVVPVLPSAFAFFLRKGPVPFVIGPINGSVPWPKGFSQIDRQRQAPGNWAGKLRNLYRFIPFAHSTFAKATAIIGGSSHICKEFARYRDKMFYVPGESGVNPTWLQESPARLPERTSTLELLHVGRLVPYKACDLALRGAASLLREGRARLTIIGEGPERTRLESLVDELGVRDAVKFCGLLPSHSEVLSQYKKSDVFLFPSLREFGGTVVFEALAFGAVPVVADYGGPGDIVSAQVGYRIPLTDERAMAQEIDSVLKHLASDRTHLEMLRKQGLSYVRECLTWEAKAQMVTEVLLWAVGVGPKPQMPPPKPAIGVL